jgi:hypothetical protein
MVQDRPACVNGEPSSGRTPKSECKFAALPKYEVISGYNGVGWKARLY